MRQSALLIIFLVVFLDLVGFGIVIPILPYYAQQFGASGWELGWLMAVYSIAQFVCAPLWGWLSDLLGRRTVLLISILGAAASMALLGLAGSLKWLFIGRALAGAFGANISTAYAYITDVTDESERAKGMGLVGAAFGLGFIFGPAIGGVLSRYGFGFPMFMAAGLALFNFVFAFLKLEEPRLTAEVRAANRDRRLAFGSIRELLGNRRTGLATVLFFLFTVAMTQMETTLAVYMGAISGYNAEDTGVLLAVMGAVMVVVQGGLIRKLAPRFGEGRLIALGTLAMGLGLTLFVATSVESVMVVALMAFAAGHGAAHPSLASLASLGAPPNRRGAVMGLYQSAGSLARFLGPPIAGWLYDRMSWRSPYFLGAALLAFCAALAALFAARAVQATERAPASRR